MFWIGFIGVYALMCIIILGGKFADELCDECINKAREVFCAFIFTMLTYAFALFYTCITLTTSNMLVGAFACAIYLVISWMVTVKIYLIIAGKTQVLMKEDKNFCHLLSMIGLILSSVIMGIDNSEIEYIILISCSISILIGAYIPISSIYEDKSLKEICQDITEEFRGAKKTVKITSLLCLCFIIMTVSSNENAVKIQKVIDAIGSGVVVGIVSMIVLVALTAIIRNKGKQK